MLQAILYDLDGTLLPMDNDHFTKVYLSMLAKAAMPWGYDPDALIQAMWVGVKAMVTNDGSVLNQKAFWSTFSKAIGKDAGQDEDKFNDFYTKSFMDAKAATGEAPLARKVVELSHQKAEHVILATNPVFPTVADESRLSWIGLNMEDFDLVTDYCNSSYCKPNPAYYRSILDQFHLDPAQCLMVGNNVTEDWQAASAVGIPCYLLTDCIINQENLPITCPHGSYEDLVAYLEQL